MDLDNTTMEVAYAAIFFVSWAFTLSQWYYALRYGTGWRWSIVLWLTTKSVFLTNAAAIWWFNWANPLLLEMSIALFALAHVELFVHWLRLEDKDAGVDGLAPPNYSGNEKFS
jgi:hypothetical protein